MDTPAHVRRLGVGANGRNGQSVPAHVVPDIRPELGPATVQHERNKDTLVQEKKLRRRTAVLKDAGDSYTTEIFFHVPHFFIFLSI